MLTLTLNNIEIDPLAQFQITQTLSGIDQLQFSFDYFEGFEIRNYEVVLKDDGVVSFVGYISTQSIVQNDEKKIIECVAFGKIEKLKRCLFHIEKNYSGNIITLLNSNNQGIVVKDYNLQSDDRFFNGQIRIQSYFDLLEDIRTKLGIQYWYDYQDDCVYLGIPDGEGLNTSGLIQLEEENNKIAQLPVILNIDHTKVANRISILSGTQNSIGMEYATVTDTAYPVITKNDLAFPSDQYTCLEDLESQAQNGLIEEFVRGININVSEGSLENKQRISNYLYQVALGKIKNVKTAEKKLVNLLYTCDNSYELKLSNVFNANYSLLGVEVTGKFLIQSITRDLTQMSNTGSHNAFVNLTTYVDRGYDKQRSYFDFLESQATNQVSIDTQSIAISSSSGSFTYSINSTFQTIQSYQVQLITNTTTTNYSVTSIKIDGQDLTPYFSNLSYSGSPPPNSTSTLDIVNSAIPLSIKAQLETTGSHTLTYTTNSTTPVTATGSINISGYK